jgi:hypothetical protein
MEQGDDCYCRLVYQKEEEMKIECKIQVTVGGFTIMMTLDEVKELRDKLNELCHGDIKQVNPFIQYGPGQRGGFTNVVGKVCDSLARGVPQWTNDPDITMRQGE